MIVKQFLKVIDDGIKIRLSPIDCDIGDKDITFISDKNRDLKDLFSYAEVESISLCGNEIVINVWEYAIDD